MSDAGGAGPPSYWAQFFRTMRASARASAGEVVPLIMELVKPRSIVDVGCGSGTWLSVFQEHGVETRSVSPANKQNLIAAPSGTETPIVGPNLASAAGTRA